LLLALVFAPPQSSAIVMPVRRLGSWGRAVGVAFACLVSHGPARAESLGERRPDGYYWAHGGLTLAGFAATGALLELGAPRRPGQELFPHFAPDVAVEHELSASAADLSDRLLAFGIATPIAAQLSDGFDVRFANAGLVYLEAHSLNALLTTATKVIVRRPRPYTHSSDPAAVELARAQGSGAYVSFFSGHSSATYTSAMAGSILYSLRTDELWARHTLWGLEFASAALTAQLRVRAGRHFRTDVWVGSLVGAGVGLLVPAVHGLPLSRVRASEWVTGGGAALFTVLLTELFDVCDGLHLCSADDVKPLSEGRAPGPEQALRWTLSPHPDAPGLALIGQF
jgi:membrane-associated phospholipid phosphatase